MQPIPPYYRKPSIQDIEPCVVSTLDILGYKEMVKDRNKATLMLDAVADAMDDVNKKIRRMTPRGNPARISYRTFSDNIIVSCGYNPYPQTDEELWRNTVPMATVMSIQAEIQTRLVIDHGVLSRGGVTLGGFYQDRKFVFGPALVDAYELEQKAGFPRILVSDILAKEFRKSVQACDGPDREDTIARTLDTFFFVDPLNKTYIHYLRAGTVIENFLARNPSKCLAADLIEGHRKGLLRAIEENRLELHTGPGIWGKYAWAVGYHNEVVKITGVGERIDPSILYE